MQQNIDVKNNEEARSISAMNNADSVGVYTIGKSVYEVTRIFSNKNTLRDIVLEKITTENIRPFN